MNHAGVQALDALEDVFAALRVHTHLTEKKRGISYPKPRVFLHLHEGPTGLFTGMRIGDEFERFPLYKKRKSLVNQA